ncbi:MAG TPA: hypothetical protein VIK86_08545 [Candidatus Paceibacterota bacterium]
MIIHQALFGYSNGHHLLCSSKQLSSSSMKILEPLSDLSGTDIQPGFSEYITGCTLENEQNYAISKTWYATEMDRPGCVWTHTLFIKFSDFACISSIDSIDNLFLRPTISGDFNEYIKPINFNVEQLMETNTAFKLTDSEIEKIYQILNVFFKSSAPILIESQETKKYNELIELMWIKLARNIFKNISFCTGSLSNRTINKRSIDIQVVPSAMIKNISRNIKNAQIVSETKDIDKLQWLQFFIREFIEHKSNQLQNFVSLLSIKNFDRKSLEVCSKLSLMLQESNSFNVLKFLTAIANDLDKEDRNVAFNKAVLMLMSSETSLLMDFHIDRGLVLQELACIDNDMLQLLNQSAILDMIEQLWKNSNIELHNLFGFLISNEINTFGEKIIITLANIVDAKSLIKLIGIDLIGINIIIRINYKLALYVGIWSKSKILQMETLECLKASSSQFTEEFISEISVLIFETSNEDICNALYETFGVAIIDSFLLWAQRKGDVEKIEHWSEICKYNISSCTKQLPQLQSRALILIIINEIDPYDCETKRISKNIWIELYKNFVTSNNDKMFNIVFAQFILIIIIQSDEEYPEDIAFFAFSQVYKMLAEDQMTYTNWKKLSIILPEVAWHNNWDKCRRLRKAAKKIGYNFHLKV